MRCANGSKTSLGSLAIAGLMTGLLASCATTVAPAAPPGDIVSGAWQHHKADFSYAAFTTRYTCSGLEDHTRQILLHLGARKDVKVIASGCPGPENTPSFTAWVKAEFYTLAPVEGAAGPAAVQAQWTALELSPQRPQFMGDGDCELVQGMKDFITKNFSLRDIEYRTQCTPHQITLDGFSVKVQALRAVPVKSSEAKG
jgi:hypothetical protein